MTDKKFYLTVYRVAVLSQEPIASTARLEDVIMESAASDKFFVEIQQSEQETVNGHLMARMLKERGIDPERFHLQHEERVDIDDV